MCLNLPIGVRRDGLAWAEPGSDNHRPEPLAAVVVAYTPGIAVLAAGRQSCRSWVACQRYAVACPPRRLRQTGVSLRVTRLQIHRRHRFRRLARVH